MHFGACKCWNKFSFVHSVGHQHHAIAQFVEAVVRVLLPTTLKGNMLVAKRAKVPNISTAKQRFAMPQLECQGGKVHNHMYGIFHHISIPNVTKKQQQVYKYDNLWHTSRMNFLFPLPRFVLSMQVPWKKTWESPEPVTRSQLQKVMDSDGY